MRVTLLSVAADDESNDVVAWARAVAPAVGACIWIELRFQPRQKDAWEEAHDRVLQLLDIA